MEENIKDIPMTDLMQCMTMMEEQGQLDEQLLHTCLNQIEQNLPKLSNDEIAFFLLVLSSDSASNFNFDKTISHVEKTLLAKKGSIGALDFGKLCYGADVTQDSDGTLMSTMPLFFSSLSEEVLKWAKSG
jgi:hypothetical protein